MGPLSKDNHLGEQQQQPDVGKVQNSTVGGCRPIRARNRLVLAVKIVICERGGLCTVHCALCRTWLAILQKVRTKEAL